jgi:hypothetical protein
MLVTLAIATARFSRVFFALCDRCGPERGAAFEGGSVIVDDDDRAPVILVADCDLDRARDKAWNARDDAMADRRPTLYALDNAAPGFHLDAVIDGA